MTNAPCRNLRISLFGSAYSLKSFENLNITGTLKIIGFDSKNFDSYKISETVAYLINNDHKRNNFHNGLIIDGIYKDYIT